MEHFLKNKLMNMRYLVKSLKINKKKGEKERISCREPLECIKVVRKFRVMYK